MADATDLSGYEGRFDTVVDSALYHCLDEEGRQAYIAALYRATRPGARLHLSCFSDGNINGVDRTDGRGARSPTSATR